METNAAKQTGSDESVIMRPNARYDNDHEEESERVPEVNKLYVSQHVIGDEKNESQSGCDSWPVTVKLELVSEDEDNSDISAGEEEDWPVTVKLEVVSECEDTNSGAGGLDQDMVVTVKQEVAVPVPGNDETVGRASETQLQPCPPQNEQRSSAVQRKEIVAQEARPDADQPNQQQRDKNLQLKACRVLAERLPIPGCLLDSIGSWTVLIIPKVDANPAALHSGNDESERTCPYSRKYNHWLIKQLRFKREGGKPVAAKRDRRSIAGGGGSKCPVCGKEFKSRYVIKSHARIHTGEKPYRCKVCSKTFTRKNTLTKHSYTHTGEKPYRCDVCDKLFKAKDNLKRHSQLHMAGRLARPYKFHERNTSNDAIVPASNS